MDLDLALRANATLASRTTTRTIAGGVSAQIRPVRFRRLAPVPGATHIYSVTPAFRVARLRTSG